MDITREQLEAVNAAAHKDEYKGDADMPRTRKVLLQLVERAQRTLTRLELPPAEPQADAPADIAALPDYWDERRRKQGKSDSSRCAAELRIALATDSNEATLTAIADELGYVNRAYGLDGYERIDNERLLVEFKQALKECPELRKGIEELASRYYDSNEETLDAGSVVADLRTLLDDVDARDSLAYLERKDVRKDVRSELDDLTRRARDVLKTEVERREPEPASYSDAQVQAALDAFSGRGVFGGDERMRAALAAAGAAAQEDAEHWRKGFDRKTNECCELKEKLWELESQKSALDAACTKSTQTDLAYDAASEWKKRALTAEAQLAQRPAAVGVTDDDLDAACAAYLNITCPLRPDAMRAALEAFAARRAVPAQRFELSAEEREAMTSGELPVWTCICRLREALDRALGAAPAPEQPVDRRVLVEPLNEREERELHYAEGLDEEELGGKTPMNLVRILRSRFPAPAKPAPAPETTADVLAEMRDFTSDDVNAVYLRALADRLEAARKNEVTRGNQ